MVVWPAMETNRFLQRAVGQISGFPRPHSPLPIDSALQAELLAVNLHLKSLEYSQMVISTCPSE